MKKRILMLLVFVSVISAVLTAQSVYEVKHSFDTRSIRTMEDVFKAAERTGMWSCDARHFVYVYDAAGSYYRSVAATSDAIYAKLDEIDFFDPLRDQKIAALMGPLEVDVTENLSLLGKDPEELAAFIGKPGADAIRAGFEVTGYLISDSGASFTLDDGLFEYEVTVYEKISESENAPDSLFAVYTIKTIRRTTPSSRALEV